MTTTARVRYRLDLLRKHYACDVDEVCARTGLHRAKLGRIAAGRGRGSELHIECLDAAFPGLRSLVEMSGLRAEVLRLRAQVKALPELQRQVAELHALVSRMARNRIDTRLGLD